MVLSPAKPCSFSIERDIWRCLNYKPSYATLQDEPDEIRGAEVAKIISCTSIDPRKIGVNRHPPGLPGTWHVESRSRVTIVTAGVAGF